MQGGRESLKTAPGKSRESRGWQRPADASKVPAFSEADASGELNLTDGPGCMRKPGLAQKIN